MRIAMTGVQCTGKTTLMNAIRDSNILKDHVFIYRLARNMKDKGVSINEGAGIIDQTLMNSMYLQCLYNEENAVLDRCLVDGMVYTHWLCHQSRLPIWMLTYWENIFSRAIGRLDMIVFLKPEFDLVADGVRSMDPAFRSQTGDFFEYYVTLAENQGVKIVRATGDVANRFEQFKKAL